MFEKEIVKALKKHVKGEVVLETPPSGLGDYAFPCFSLAKVEKKSPAQIAVDLAKTLEIPPSCERVEAHGPYVNFFLDKKAIGKLIINGILDNKDKFGGSKTGKGKVVAIDFSHPNIGKPFHFGHLRSTIIGESVGRLLEFHNYKVERLNYLGDWGTQFGAMIHAFKEWGDEKELDKNPIEYLVGLYIKFNQEAEKNPELKEKAREWFSKLEKGDEEAAKLWGLFKSHSLEEFKRIYEILDSKFDSYNGESYYSRQVDDAIAWVKKKGVSEVDEGALIVRLEGFEVPLMLKKSDGSSTYGSRDLAAVMDRIHNLKADKVLYVVDHGQSLHFEQLFSVMDLMGHAKDNFSHVSFGLYLSEEGGKLSTRKGKIILMREVLDEAINLAKKTIEEKNSKLKNKDEVARFVGVGAVKFGDLLNDRIKDVVFNLEKILSFEGDTGPYLMYTHARAASILRKAGDLKPSNNADFSLLIDDTEQRVLKLLMAFPEKTGHAVEEHKPHIIAQYLIELGRSFNEFYHKCPCLQEKNKDLQLARLTLIEASRQVLENGLRLLGIAAPFEM